MLLLSDGGGEIDSKRAMAVYKSIRDRQLRFVVAGIGSKQGYLLRKAEDDKSPVLTALDEEKLKKIVEACKGVYFNGNEDPVRISAGIFSKKVMRQNAFEGKQSVYYIPLILAIIAFGLAFKL